MYEQSNQIATTGHQKRSHLFHKVEQKISANHNQSVSINQDMDESKSNAPVVSVQHSKDNHELSDAQSPQILMRPNPLKKFSKQNSLMSDTSSTQQKFNPISFAVQLRRQSKLDINHKTGDLALNKFRTNSKAIIKNMMLYSQFNKTKQDSELNLKSDQQF